MAGSGGGHVPVLLNAFKEIVKKNFGNRKDGFKAIDATFGGGGYTRALAGKPSNYFLICRIGCFNGFSSGQRY